MPIVLFRVDERLIHGQVVVGWGERIHIDRIVVVDDELSKSAWEQELYCLGVPPSIDAAFSSVDEALRLIGHWENEPRRVIVLVRDVDTLYRIAEAGELRDIKVNLGGLHHAPGRDRVLPYLFLNQTDRDKLRRIGEMGVQASAQDLPSSRPIPLEDLLARD